MLKIFFWSNPSLQNHLGRTSLGTLEPETKWCVGKKW